ncbi:hypothetical protein ANN_15385 [Periplaneta americana]|uniref:Uncharacterized protein n=1 Tax=Periplaneta americana TaxID=6978 RepID=A0ABQ8SGI8_PERAM|nr:hypothetical protein ANN_15385 [Periplaneta americana]
MAGLCEGGNELAGSLKAIYYIKVNDICSSEKINTFVSTHISEFTRYCTRYYHLVVDERNITVRYYPMSDTTQLSPTYQPEPQSERSVFLIMTIDLYRSEISQSSEDEPVSKRKRGVVNENTSYKRNTIRNARVKGEGYVSYYGPTFSLYRRTPVVEGVAHGVSGSQPLIQSSTDE